jgi:tRNA threonylcarbamoyladenosine biosynthesis protein TsaE
MTHVIESDRPSATHALGVRLGEGLFSGAVVALSGQLGAGKTFLVRAIAEGLGVPDSRVVSSPTFVLIQEYAGRLPVYHFDTYRLKTQTDFASLGIYEYFNGEGVCLVEWADRVAPLLPAERLDVHLEVTGDQSRRLTLIGHGSAHVETVHAIANA